MDSQLRLRNRYHLCPHCNKNLNIKRFKEHKRLYFNESSKQWIFEGRSKESGEDSNSDSFSSLDECDTGELSNPTLSTQEAQMSDLDEFTKDQSEPVAGGASEPPSLFEIDTSKVY